MSQRTQSSDTFWTLHCIMCNIQPWVLVYPSENSEMRAIVTWQARESCISKSSCRYIHMSAYPLKIDVSPRYDLIYIYSVIYCIVFLPRVESRPRKKLINNQLPHLSFHFEKGKWKTPSWAGWVIIHSRIQLSVRPEIRRKGEKGSQYSSWLCIRSGSACFNQYLITHHPALSSL